MKVWVVLRNTWVGDNDSQITVDSVFSTEEAADAYARRESTAYRLIDVDGPHEVDALSSSIAPSDSTG